MSADRGPLFDATTKRAFIVAGVLAIIGVGALLKFGRRTESYGPGGNNAVEVIRHFKAAIEAVVNDEHASAAAVQAAIERIDKEPDKWKDRSTEADIVAARARLVGMLPKQVCFRPVPSEWIESAGNAIANWEFRTTHELLDTKARLSQLALDSAALDDSQIATVKELSVKLDRVLVTKFREEAATYAAQPTTTPHQGLAEYAEAEDYVIKALYNAKKTKNKADEDSYTATYKALLAESDAYATRVVTPEFIAGIPWKDLLSGDLADRWSKSGSIPGFKVRIENGVLTVDPPEPGCKQQGVLGIFDQKTDNLRHFVLDMEFAVEGTVTMFFHVSPAPAMPDNRQSMTYDLVGGKEGLEPGRKYAMEATFIGSDLTIRFPDSGEMWSADPSWVKLRKGGIAFLVPEGARLKITRMRIKELR